MKPDLPTTRLRVLLLLEYAPDYREPFLRQLSKVVNLTVVAQPCSSGPGWLVAPRSRSGYTYIELPRRKFFALSLQPGLNRIVNLSNWDIVCAGFNLRHLTRNAIFLLARRHHKHWIWWGQIVGQSNSPLVHFVRRVLLGSAAASLTYSVPQAELIKALYGIHSVSFNNSETSLSEMRPGHFNEHPDLHFLYVGSNKPRKKLERLIAMANCWSDVHVRLIGLGMDHIPIPDELLRSGRVTLYGHMRGQALEPHFDWADLVVSPGSVGLLVMSAARHGKGIAVDKDSTHGLEYWLAEKSGQPFVAFGNQSELSEFLNQIRGNRDLFENWGKSLQSAARKEFTVEHMVQVHLETFESVHRRASR